MQNIFTTSGQSTQRTLIIKQKFDKLNFSKNLKLLLIKRCHKKLNGQLDGKKYATRKLLELINEFDKVAGYKIYAQKSLAFLYTNDEKSEREIQETLPFTTATKRIKYLGINLPKETKDLRAEDKYSWNE